MPIATASSIAPASKNARPSATRPRALIDVIDPIVRPARAQASTRSATTALLRGEGDGGRADFPVVGHLKHREHVVTRRSCQLR